LVFQELFVVKSPAAQSFHAMDRRQGSLLPFLRQSCVKPADLFLHGDAFFRLVFPSRRR
jgi:hypothetical protein